MGSTRALAVEPTRVQVAEHIPDLVVALTPDPVVGLIQVQVAAHTQDLAEARTQDLVVGLIRGPVVARIRDPVAPAVPAPADVIRTHGIGHHHIASDPEFSVGVFMGVLR